MGSLNVERLLGMKVEPDVLGVQQNRLVRTLGVWSYLIQWKVRGHKRNHATFCYHETKCWRWYAKDGCSGLVCDWCYLLERWCPTLAPDVEEAIRITPDGQPDPGWEPPPFPERIDEAIEKIRRLVEHQSVKAFSRKGTRKGKLTENKN